MLISVIIPHLNQPEYLSKVLAALSSQRGFQGRFEIIVVDNGSNEMPIAICDGWPETQLLQELSPGPGHARNLGIKTAKGEILAFIDADCVAHENWLSSIENTFRDLNISVIGGDVRVPFEDKSRPTLLESYERIYAYRNRDYIASGYSGTGNLAMRRPAFDRVGPFGGIEIAEDRDWGRRARALGVETHYVPEMIVYHPARKSFLEMQKKWDRHIAHDFSDVVTPAKQARWIVRSFAVCLSPIGEIPRILFSDRVKGAKQRMLALFCLLRIRIYRFRKMLAVLWSGDGRLMSGAWNRK